MLMGETWNGCTISFLNSIIVKSKYLPEACHGSAMFLPEAHADVKLADKDVNYMLISRDPPIPELNLFHLIKFISRNKCLFQF